MDSQDEMSDSELVQAVLSTGNARFYDRLIQRHAGRIYSMVYGMVLNHADTEELVQDIFLRAYLKLDGFKRKSTFSTWLYRIAFNTVLDHQRKTGRNPVASVAEPPPSSAPRSSQPDANLSNREMDRDIRKALERLSPKLRAAIVCHVIDGMSVPRIAKAQKCSQATIYWRIHSARKKLRKDLGKYL